MAKNVFKPMQLYNMPTEPVQLDAPVREMPEEIIELVEEYTGPTADDIRRESEVFRANWEKEKSELIARAQAEAEAIKKEAEEEAFRKLKEKNDQADRYLEDKESSASTQTTDAEERSAKMITDAEDRVIEIEKDAYQKGFEEGRKSGYEEGHDEADRLIERIHTIINSIIEKRKEIIEDAETQVIDLVLLISRKVVKVISENQRNVVINNVVQALRKLKSRGDVVIRVNLDDLDLATEHVKDFMKMVENVNSIQVLEDTSIDRGGCVIETDFGEIDAKISSQLREIEDKVLELMPVKSGGEG